jgi:trk system potassium uptake protein TrkA
MIAGGGKVGLRLARAAAGQYQVKIIEANRAGALRLPGHAAAVRRAGAARRQHRRGPAGRRERAGHGPVHRADQRRRGQHHACLLAKRMGARRVLALINRRAYADLVQGTQIDIAISPAHAVIGELLATCGAATWRPCTACAAARPRRWRPWCAATARPARWSAGASTRSSCRRGAQIGAIVRAATTTACDSARREVIIPHHDTVIEPATTSSSSAAQAHGARGGEAVPGARHLPSEPHAMNSACWLSSPWSAAWWCCLRC